MLALPTRPTVCQSQSQRKNLRPTADGARFIVAPPIPRRAQRASHRRRDLERARERGLPLIPANPQREHPEMGAAAVAPTETASRDCAELWRGTREGVFAALFIRRAAEHHVAGFVWLDAREPLTEAAIVDAHRCLPALALNRRDHPFGAVPAALPREMDVVSDESWMRSARRPVFGCLHGSLRGGFSLSTRQHR